MVTRHQSAGLPSTPGVVARWTARDSLFVGAVFAAMLLAYAPLRQAGFIWDDDSHVTANPCIIGPLGLREIWTTAAANYFPLVLTNFWVQHSLWGLNPLPYHAVTVLLHAACVVLLWRVLLRLRVPGAGLGALLWGFHPVQVESVAWISELKNTQSALFYLLAVRFFVRWIERQPSVARESISRDYVCALSAAVLAILSKPSTVMLPLALALCWWWIGRPWRWRSVLGWLAPFLAISALAGGWTIWEQKFHSLAQGPEWSQTWAERGVIAGKVIWFYLEKLLWPQPLIFIYPRWIIDATRLVAWLPLAAALAVGTALWFQRKTRARAGFFAAAYFAVTLFPVLGFFDVYFFRYSFVGDHFQYLASMGPAAFAGAAIAASAAYFRMENTFLMRMAKVGLLVGLGVMTWRQCAIYLSNEALWRDTVARNPTAWIACNNLGLELSATNRLTEAIPLYEAAVRLNPGSADIRVNLGNAMVQAGRPAEAIACFEAAIGLNPQLPEPHNSLGVVLAGRGDFAGALPRYAAALRLRPDYAEAHWNIGTGLTKLGRLAEALPHYQAAAFLQPKLERNHRSLGAALLDLGRPAEALAAWLESLRLSPNDAWLHYRVGSLWFSAQNRYADAAGHFAEAVRLQPDLAEAHHDLGTARFQMEDFAAAIGHYRKALELRPENAAFHCDLGVALERSGRFEEAADQYAVALKIQPDYADAGRYLAGLQTRLSSRQPKR